MAHLGTSVQGTSTSSELLSISNQIAPRGVVNTAFCFPFSGGHQARQNAYKHLRAALDMMARDYPFLAGTIQPDFELSSTHVPQGRLRLNCSTTDSIPLHCQYALDTFGCTYDELKARKFPQGAFVGPRYDSSQLSSNAGKRASVLEVCVIFIQGGLVLVITNHHSVMDGGSRKRIFDCLGCYTRGHPYGLLMDPKQYDIHNRITELINSCSYGQLLGLCPEYCLLPDKSGPCEPSFLSGGVNVEDIEMCGKIFRFTEKKLKELRVMVGVDAITNPDVTLAVQQQPSIYMTLAALTWAHVSRARLETERNASASNNEAEATLMTPVSWKEHALKEANANYFGNAVATVFTKASISQLLRACVTVRGLSELVRRVHNAVKEVNEEYMCRRFALYKRTPDPRSLGLKFDIRNPQDYTFNTWRWFGGGTEWNIPGVSTTKADAIRRAAASHKLGAIVILPASTPAADQELYVELPKVSMDRLCTDHEWMKWVDEVIE